MVSFPESPTSTDSVAVHTAIVERLMSLAYLVDWLLRLDSSNTYLVLACVVVSNLILVGRRTLSSGAWLEDYGRSDCSEASFVAAKVRWGSSA